MLLIPDAMGIKEWVNNAYQWYSDSTVKQVIDKSLVWGVDVMLAAFFLLGDTRLMAIVALCIISIGRIIAGIGRAAGLAQALRQYRIFSWSLLWKTLVSMNIRIACSFLFVLAAAVMLVFEGELGAFRASIVLLCAVLGTVGAVVADANVVLSLSLIHI